MQGKIDRKGNYDEKRIVASLEKNSKQWENNYCWAIDRTSNNHHDIMAMVII